MRKTEQNVCLATQFSRVKQIDCFVIGAIVQYCYCLPTVDSKKYVHHRQIGLIKSARFCFIAAFLSIFLLLIIPCAFESKADFCKNLKIAAWIFVIDCTNAAHVCIKNFKTFFQIVLTLNIN